MFIFDYFPPNPSAKAETLEEAKKMFAARVVASVKASGEFPSVTPERIFFDDWKVAYETVMTKAGYTPVEFERGSVESLKRMASVRYSASRYSLDQNKTLERGFAASIRDAAGEVFNASVHVSNGAVTHYYESRGLSRSEEDMTEYDTVTGAKIASFTVFNSNPIGYQIRKTDMSGNELEVISAVYSMALLPDNIKAVMAPFLYASTVMGYCGNDVFCQELPSLNEALVTEEVKLEVAHLIDQVTPDLRERIRLSSRVLQKTGTGENDPYILVNTAGWV